MITRIGLRCRTRYLENSDWAATMSQNVTVSRGHIQQSAQLGSVCATFHAGCASLADSPGRNGCVDDEGLEVHAEGWLRRGSAVAARAQAEKRTKTKPRWLSCKFLQPREL